MRYPPSGNVLTGAYVKRLGGNVLSDEQAEAEAEIQDMDFEEDELRDYVRLMTLQLMHPRGNR